MTIAEFDHLDINKKRELLQQCCGSTVWVDKMLAEPPFEDLVELEETAEEKWSECNEQDWLEAFQHHPKIGETQSVHENFSSTAQWAMDEQSGVSAAPGYITQQLTKLNHEYQNKYGFIFIVCATGKSADEMLQLIKERLNNDREKELSIAADEQLRITKLRLEKLFA